MIYDRTNIVENFRGLIGFKPSFDASNATAKIDESLKQSQSGQYLNSLHSYFTPEVFSNVANNYAEYSVSAWSNTTGYLKDDVVMYNAAYYVALRATTGGQPASSPSDWQKTTLLSRWVQDKYDGAVLATVDALMEANKLEGQGKELKGNLALFDGEGLKSNTITKSGRFVGFEIDITQPNISVTLQRMGMQLTQGATVPIHIIYNGVDTVINPTFNGNSRFNYQDVTPITFFDGMGPIQIGYYEDDLGPASAIYVNNQTFSQSPCYTCGSSDTGRRSTWGKWINVTPISILDDETAEHYDTNFGMNLTFSFRCDLSDILIREKMSLVPALKAMLKVTFMEAIAANVRNNQQADQTQVLVYNQLRDYQHPSNPYTELKRAIKALQFEFSNINPDCLPCKTGGIRIRHRVI